MRFHTYTKYDPNFADAVDLQALLDQLADFLLQSGFAGGDDYWGELGEGDRSLDALRDAILRALLDSGQLSPEMIKALRGDGDEVSEDKLAELIGDLEGEDLALAMGDLFGRIAYVDYFALVTDYVPEYVPYEGGELWKNAILHVLTPRAFYPDKPPLTPDSEVTMRYTGLHLASEEQGTSISIGYMGESYVDFGPYGMFIPVFILGVLWGLMYYYFMTRARLLVVGYAFATTLLLSAYQFEMTGIKLLGGVTMRFIVLALIMYFAEKRIGKWLQKGSQAERVPAHSMAHEGG